MPTGVEEAAALAGIIGLAFQCLQGCVYGFKLLNTALHLGKDSAFIRCALLLEEYRLLHWAKSSGLADESLIDNLDAKVVQETIAELQILLTDAEVLQKRYKLDIRFEPPTNSASHGDEYHPISDEDLRFLENDALQRERAKIMARSKAIQKDVSAIKKFWFAAVDKDKFSNLLASIGKLNDGLESLLNAVQQDATRQDLRSLRLQGIAAANELRDIKNLFEALTLGHYGEQDLARFKQFKSFRESESKEDAVVKELEQLLRQKPSSFTIVLEELSADKLKQKAAVPAAPLAAAVQKYEDLAVYVEWKQYGWTARSLENKKRVIHNIETLALLLGAPKNPEFRTLRCRGMLEDIKSESYRLVYYWPSGYDGDENPTSLKKIMSSPGLPSLTERMQVARNMANSLLLLQACNWLHKAICSQNVLFFPKKNIKPLTDPYLVGFEYSRPDAVGEPSELPDDPELTIYRHPSYLKKSRPPFDKVFDIYSLGLILIELAQWRPLQQIYLKVLRNQYLEQNVTDKKQRSSFWKTEDGKSVEKGLLENCNQNNLETLRKKFLEELSSDNDEIAFRTGSKYAGAVRFCLGEDLDKFIGTRSQADEKALQEAFFVNVVRRLDELVV
jgi:hypothetical protein